MSEALRLLVVEDEGIVALDLKATLERLGYQVVGVTGRGDEAVAMSKADKPDLVLMDIQLVGPLDGIDAAATIRKELDIPVIFLTGQTDPATLSRAQRSEPFGYIVKPFEERSLKPTIQMAYYRAASERTRRLAEALEAENRRLHAVSDARDRFVSMASHELKTPLTPITINVRLLARRLVGRMDEQEARLMQSLERNVKRLAELIQDLLDASRAQSGNLTVRPADIDLQPIAMQAVEAFQELAGMRGVRLAIESQPAPAWGDAARVTQIVGNLIENALKFTPKGGSVTVRVRAGPNDAWLDVEDTGIGLTGAQMADLFKPFSMVQTGPMADVQTTGLGLYVSRAIAEAQQGHLNVTSPGTGKGSAFHLRIPKAPPA